MRSPLWFMLAGVIAVAGFVAAAFHLVAHLGGVESRLMQVVVPGTAVLSLKEPGSYTIYLETSSVVDGRVYTSNSTGGLRIAVQAPGGREVELAPRGGARYQFGGREGRSLFSFQANAPGEYRITGTLPDGRTEPKVVLAVESGLLGGMMRMIGGAIGMVFAGLAIAGIIVAITLWQRQKARRA